MFELSKSSATSLEYLNLSQNQALNDECLVYLGQLIGLKCLCISNTSIKMSPLMAMGRTLKNLQRLDISKNLGIRHKTTDKLAEAFPFLTDLCLSTYLFHTAKTASMAPQNFRAFKNLKTLTLVMKKEEQQTDDWKI